MDLVVFGHEPGNTTATAATAVYYEPCLGFDSLETETLVHNMPNTIICRERQVRLHLLNYLPSLFHIPLKRSQEREPKGINPPRNIRVQLCQSRDQLDRFHTEALLLQHLAVGLDAGEEPGVVLVRVVTALAEGPVEACSDFCDVHVAAAFGYEPAAGLEAFMDTLDDSYWILLHPVERYLVISTRLKGG